VTAGRPLTAGLAYICPQEDKMESSCLIEDTHTRRAHQFDEVYERRKQIAQGKFVKSTDLLGFSGSLFQGETMQVR